MVVRMRIAGHHPRGDAVQSWQFVRHASEDVASTGGPQIADMRTEEQLPGETRRHRVLLLPAQSKYRVVYWRISDRHRRVAAGTAQNDGLYGHDTHHRVI